MESRSDGTSGNGPGTQSHRSARDAALRGAAAGVIGSLALLFIERAAQATLLPAGTRVRPESSEVADALARSRDVQLSDGASMALGAGLQLGYGAMLGAALGLVRERVDAPGLAYGLALGALSYMLSDSAHGIRTRVGAAPTPMQQPLERAAIPIGTHLAFGIATAAAYGMRE